MIIYVKNVYYSVRGNSGTTYDSTLYIDKEYKFLRKFEIQTNKSFLYALEDGVMYSSDPEKAIIKYDINGKEEWRYKYQEPIYFGNKKAPYIGIFFTPNDNRTNFILIDKNGKKMGTTEPQIYGNDQIYPSNDKGFWMVNSQFEYIKFDSTGKQTAKFSDFAGNRYKNIGEDNYPVLADNSLLVSYRNDDGVLLIKISPTGDVLRYKIPAQINIKYIDYYTSFKFKIITPNKLLNYFFRYQASDDSGADLNIKIGAINLENLSPVWQKDLVASTITFEANNSFFEAYRPKESPLNTKFRVYDVNGDLKWESPFLVASVNSTNQLLTWKIVGDILYTHTPTNKLSKIKYLEGKTLWTREGIFIDNFERLLKIDDNGNEVVFYRNYLENTAPYEIAVLNSDGSSKWKYRFLNGVISNSFNGSIVKYLTPNDNTLIVYSLENKDNKNQLILRKISPCEALNAIAITANKTEACPAEKIKLSIPKQEGVTYQWQKDGKDLPNLTDAVYDFGESGTYTVVVKDESCQNQAVSNALKINIRQLPTAQITAPKSTFCDGEKVTIASQTNGTFFQWQKDEKDIPNATSGIYEATQTGNYRVGVRDDKCPQVGLSNIIPITIKSLPEAKISTDIKTVIYEPFTVKMTANTGTGLSYQWLKDDVIIPNETNNTYEAKKSGKYNVSVTKDGCVKTSEALNISIQIALSAESEINEETVQIYPNPSRGEFKLILPKSLQNSEIQLFDLLGREQTLLYTGEQARAEGLVRGTYFLKVTKGEKSVTNKIVVE